MSKDAWKIAKFMVTRRNDQLFGETEFTLRDMMLRTGARVLEATVNDRKKGGIKAAASSARTVARTRNFTVGASEPS